MTKGGSLHIFHPSPGCGASIGARCRRWCGSLRASCPSTAEWACQGLWRSLGRSLGPNRVADGRSTVLEWTVVDVDRTWHEDDHKSQRTCTCTAYYFVLESRLWIIMNIIDAHLVQVDAPTLPDLNHTGSSFSAFSVPPSSIRPSTTSAYHLRHTSRWVGRWFTATSHRTAASRERTLSMSASESRRDQTTGCRAGCSAECALW